LTDALMSRTLSLLRGTSRLKGLLRAAIGLHRKIPLIGRSWYGDYCAGDSNGHAQLSR